MFSKGAITMRAIVCTLLLLSASIAAAAQSKSNTSEIDLAVTYSTVHSNLTNGNDFWRQGGGIELSAEAFHGLGVVASVLGNHIDNAGNSGAPLTAITTTFGPRYTWSTKRVALFGQGLIGESQAIDGIFPTPQRAVTTWNAFALQVGGGVDLRLARHFAVRAVQADWIRTQFPNATTNVQNSLRLGSGVVLRFR
jgi:hypothetical protein